MKLIHIALLCATPFLINACAAPVVVVGAAGTTAAVAVDERTAGTMVDDQNIELKITTHIRDDAELQEQTHVNVTSYNGIVLLSGEVSHERQKSRVGELARKTAKVRHVHNELVVGELASFASRSKDGWITTKVKSKLLGDDEVKGLNIKVVTENRTVFLMGMVSREQGDMAARVIQDTSGVERIVKLFEYIQ